MKFRNSGGAGTDYSFLSVSGDNDTCYDINGRETTITFPGLRFEVDDDKCGSSSPRDAVLNVGQVMALVDELQNWLKVKAIPKSTPKVQMVLGKLVD